MNAANSNGQVPSVSIGLATYNREATIARAIDSALAQTHGDLELVISDNASSDGTAAICERYAASDPRVRYLRHAVNRGPTANFNTLFGECRGAHVMMLADDDWLEPDYVERCLAELESSPGHALVCGRARYFTADGRAAESGVALQLQERSGAARTVAYYGSVRDNGTFYGLMPRAVLARAAPLPNVLGNDWLLVAAVAYQGTVRTLETTAIHRELGGTSVDVATIAATFGKSGLQARVPHLVIAWHVFAHVARRGAVYRAEPAPRRVALAVRCALVSIDWRSLAWHATAPTALALGEHRYGRWIFRLYDRVTRRLGASGLERP